MSVRYDVRIPIKRTIRLSIVVEDDQVSTWKDLEMLVINEAIDRGQILPDDGDMIFYPIITRSPSSVPVKW
ncbi:MAG: hypothetical protein EP299_01770 [Acidobacteria bacterium]|nr:MAG: hypothetical protein EP299_01770 [Acidobacteriota bacterium]